MTGGARRAAVGSALIWALGWAAACGAGAQTPSPSPSSVREAARDPFEQVLLARQVADFARAHRDWAAMATAARILQEVPMRDEGGEPGAAAFTPKALMAEAKALAPPELRDTLALAPATRGVLKSAFGTGLVRVVQEVAARGGFAFPLTARVGEPLKVGAIGDAGRNMAIRITSAGKVMCLDDRGDYAPVCVLHPLQPIEVRVEVLNRSATSTRAVILSN